MVRFIILTAIMFITCGHGLEVSVDLPQTLICTIEVRERIESKDSPGTFGFVAIKEAHIDTTKSGVGRLYDADTKQISELTAEHLYRAAIDSLNTISIEHGRVGETTMRKYMYRVLLHCDHSKVVVSDHVESLEAIPGPARVLLGLEASE